MSEGKRPIVIRRKKATSHASHGAWKIAYADFMTAMMAFFLVMWLLSGLSSAEMAQVSDYFRTPLKVAMVGGDKNSASNSAIPGGGDDPIHSEGEVQRTTPNAVNYRLDSELLQRMKTHLHEMMQSDAAFDDLRSQIRVEIVHDGLRIQILDSGERPMFKLGRSQLAPFVSEILAKMAPILNELPNKITLTGHTDDLRYAMGPSAYSNWELSADRANAARRALIIGGMQPEKLLRVIGVAATVGVAGDSAAAAANRRISILVLNARAQARMAQQNMARRERPLLDAPGLLTQTAMSKVAGQTNDKPN